MKITVIVTVNEKCPFTNEVLVKAVVPFKAVNILSHDIKIKCKNSSSKQFVQQRI